MAEKTVLITGITGYLGSHIAQKLLSSNYLRQIKHIVGTTTKKNPQKLAQFNDMISKTNGKSKLTLLQADCMQDRNSLAKAASNVDIILHTACPFMDGSLAENTDKINCYVESSTNLALAASHSNLQKFIMTGAASSIVGHSPQDEHTYNNPMIWADSKMIMRPNEKGKLLAERACWNIMLKDDTSCQMRSILPYFMSGPPLYAELVKENTSCIAIQSILDNSQFGFPEISLPMIDVRDVAEAHIRAAGFGIQTNRIESSRYLMSQESILFSEIIKKLQEESSNLGLKRRIKTQAIPFWMLQMASWGPAPELKHLLPFMNKEFKIDGLKARFELGLDEYIDIKDVSLIEMAHKLVEFQATSQENN